MIERTHAWSNQYGKLRWCTERRRLVVEFWLALASAAIVCGRLVAGPGPATAGKAVLAAAHERLLVQPLTTWPAFLTICAETDLCIALGAS